VKEFQFASHLELSKRKSQLQKIKVKSELGRVDGFCALAAVVIRNLLSGFFLVSVRFALCSDAFE